MGISDDIRPKKRLGFSNNPSFSTHNHFKPQEQETEQEIESTEKTDKIEVNSVLADDFFDSNLTENKKNTEDKNAKKAKQKEKKPSRIGKFLKTIFLNRWLYAFLISALVISILWYHYPAIKALFFDDVKKEENTTPKDDSTDQIYQSEITPTNYTSEAETSAPSTESQTMEQVIDKSTIQIKILNGNGVRGSADQVKAELVSKGFTIKELGNAKVFTYTNSIIYYKTGKEGEAALVKENLDNQNAVLTLSDTIVGSYDIVLVVGKN